MAGKSKLSNCISFIPEKYQYVNSIGADVVLLIGVLCPLSVNLSIRLVKDIYQYVKKGGLLIFSTVTEEMCYDDPFTEYLMRLVGWRMDYKTEQMSIEIAEKNKFKVRDIFYSEPLKYHCMVVCEK